MYSVSENFALVRPFIKQSGFTSHWLGFVNIYLQAKNYQNIRCILRVVLYIQFLNFFFALARLFIKTSGIRLSH